MRRLITGFIFFVLLFSGWDILIRIRDKTGKLASYVTASDQLTKSLLGSVLLVACGIFAAYICGLLLEKALHTKRITEYIKKPESKGGPSPFLRLGINLARGGVDPKRLARNPEVVWENDYPGSGDWAFGIISREISPDFVWVAEYTTGLSVTSGFPHLLEKRRLHYTGRIGSDLFADLMQLGTGEDAALMLLPKLSALALSLKTGA